MGSSPIFRIFHYSAEILILCRISAFSFLNKGRIFSFYSFRTPKQKKQKEIFFSFRLSFRFFLYYYDRLLTYAAAQIAATAPSLTAVAACRTSLTQISPAAYTPGRFVSCFSLVTRYPSFFSSSG